LLRVAEQTLSSDLEELDDFSQEDKILQQRANQVKEQISKGLNE
jgi:hypothetical protein